MVDVVVLGITQDGGRPQFGCFKECCKNQTRLFASSLAVVLPKQKSFYIIDATPDFREQCFLFW